MKSQFPFDPNATEYTNDNAAFMCDAAAQAYEDEDACRGWATDNGFTESFHFLDSKPLDHLRDTQGFVAQSPAAILLAFRGTEPKHIADVTSDAAVHRTTWEGLGDVHEGFFRAFFAVWGKSFGGTRVLPDLPRTAGGRKIWITGHSLGGALAQICAAQTELRDGIPVHAVYTYGQPRVGDAAFARVMNERLGRRIFRLVNDRDVVPRVPFYSLGFRHCGQEFFFDKNESRRDRPSSVETLVEALDSYRKTLRFDELAGVAHGALGIAGNLVSGSGGDGSILRRLEDRIDVKKIAVEGTEKITDHLMKSGYKLLFA